MYLLKYHKAGYGYIIMLFWIYLVALSLPKVISNQKEEKVILDCIKYEIMVKTRYLFIYQRNWQAKLPKKETYFWLAMVDH